MSNYEFWEELGKIFNAVVAYQEKTIEFNKRFINPWIRLGNVFDKQDRNKEAVDAYRKAIEIDPDNAQNWHELGNIHFKMANYDEAIEAFNKAIELDPAFGWAYCNLALTLVTQGKPVQAIPLYRKSIELLVDDKDRAMAWNRLGNVYRKLNEYALAVEAFQKADELDHENAGFRDDLDEAPEAPAVIESGSPEAPQEAVPVTVTPIELIMAEGRAEEAAAQESAPAAAGTSAPVEASTEVETQPVQVAAVASDAQPETIEGAKAESVDVASGTQAAEASTETLPAASEASDTRLVAEGDRQQASGTAPEPSAEPIAEIADVAAVAESAVGGESGTNENPGNADTIEAAEASVEAAAFSEETVSVVVQSTVETITETVILANASNDTSQASVEDGQPNDPVAELTPTAEGQVNTEDTVAASGEPETSAETLPLDETRPIEVVSPIVHEDEPSQPQSEPASAVAVLTSAVSAPEPEPAESTAASQSTSETPALSAAAESVVAAAVDPVSTASLESAEAAIEPTTLLAEAQDNTSADPRADQPGDAQQAAYEAFLKDNNELISLPGPAPVDEALSAEDLSEGQKPVAQIDPSGDLRIEMDTKNAHVWNELGNVYFNTGAFDDAVIAYSKAIELDRWFAWPYSNLALAYVQKGRFAEAILLYQRSIELFTSEKDKAISWNRLGNVYRRLNDYENAISAYQRADELDPDNTTLSLQNRFSLLGSYAVEPKPSYAA